MTRKNKFYWVEGVTAKEIRSSLNDPRWSPLRTRRVRRTLVLAFAAVLAAVSSLALIDSDANAWVDLTGLSGAVLVMVGYLVIRTSVRNLADAPDELLDERQIAVRNEVYLHAYRLSTVPILIVIVFHAFGVPTPEFLWISMAMTMATLPSMVLAWNLPGETRDASE